MSKFTFPSPVSTSTPLPQLATAMNQNMRALERWSDIEPDPMISFYWPADLVVVTVPIRIYLPYPCSVQSVGVMVATAPVGSDAIFDLHLDGVTMFTTQANRPTIPDGGYYSGYMRPDIIQVPFGSYLTVAVDQVGAGTAGSYPLFVIRLGKYQ